MIAAGNNNYSSEYNVVLNVINKHLNLKNKKGEVLILIVKY